MFFHDLKLSRELKIERRVDREVEHELHMHDFLELNVLIDGEARFKLLGEEYRGTAGDVFLFRPYEPHYNLAVEESAPFTWIMVLFSPSIVRLIPHGSKLLYPFYTQTVAPHLPRALPYAQAIQAAALAAYEEQARQLPGWESKQFMHFIDLLVQVYRYAVEAAGANGHAEGSAAGATEASSAPERGGGPEVHSGVVLAVEYILKHITEEIDIQDVIEVYGRGKTYFYTEFKRTVGVTPNQFIHRLRLQIAMHLLKTTNKSVTDIAFECGYNSIHYFNKHFKQYGSVSPREFRKAR